MNLVLITIDCLRADHLSCTGYGHLTSPFIDSLAEKGMLFKQVIINGVGTFASSIALLTSTYPLMYGGYEKVNRKTIAEVLQERGYVTAAFNDNAFLSPYFGFNRGFDYFCCLSLERGGELKTKVMNYAKKLFYKNSFLLKFATTIYSIVPKRMNGEVINQKVLAWLKENCKSKFFIWIHYMDVHGPHYAPKEYFHKLGLLPPSSRALTELNAKLAKAVELYRAGVIEEDEIELLKNTYDAEIRFVDNCIKDLFDVLISLGVDKNTFIIVTGDHGEEFFEHGGYHSHENFYDEMLRVPLIIYGPGVPNKVIDGQVEQINIAPTILHLLEEKEEPSFKGRSLLNEKPESESIISEVSVDYIRSEKGKIVIKTDFRTRKASVRTERNNEKWKYIYSAKTGQEELYDLATDPNEKNNLLKGEIDFKTKDIWEELKEKLEKHFKIEEEQLRIKKITRKLGQKRQDGIKRE